MLPARTDKISSAFFLVMLLDSANFVTSSSFVMAPPLRQLCCYEWSYTTYVNHLARKKQLSWRNTAAGIADTPLIENVSFVEV
jgi:hypothetical protein